MEQLWTAIKTFWLDHAKHWWVEDHLIYFSVIFGGLAIAIIIFIINRKIQKSIDEMNRTSRKSNVKLMRDTSANKKKEKEIKSRLTFNEE